jgi:hypothetical protein
MSRLSWCNSFAGVITMADRTMRNPIRVRTVGLHLLHLASLAACVATLCSPARAAQAAPSAHTAQPSTGPADVDEIKTPRRMLAAAQDQMNAAQHELENVNKQLRPAFEASPEWTDAQAALTDARAAKKAASDPVLARLHERDDYKAALDARTKAAAHVDQLKSSPSASMSDIALAAKASADAAGVVTKLEAAALDGDEGVRAATAKLADAQAKIPPLEAKFKASVLASPEYTKARQQLEAARIKRDKAQIALDNMLRRQQQQQQQRQQQQQKHHQGKY